MQGWSVAVDQEELKPYANHQQELSLHDGCILWGSRVMVPPPGHAQVMDELHDDHPGVSQIGSLSRSFVSWMGMDCSLE